MDYYIDADGILYDKVKYHTRKKHEFIRRYLDIWAKQVKKNAPTLDIFDMYASTGMCYCGDAEEGRLIESSWDGSALLAAKCLMSYSGGSNCLFLNTYNKDEKKISPQKENLERLLSSIKFPYPYKIETLPIERAVEAAICRVIPRYPNLWLLDPHAISGLPWSVVEKISGLRGEYDCHGKRCIRKPEMIISLMTEDLRWHKTHPDLITTSLGLDEGCWRPIFDELIEAGNNVREAFLTLYMERLSSLYDKSPVCIEVNTTKETAIVYCVMLITESNAGYFLTNKQLLPEYENWRITTWQDGARKIVLEQDLTKKGQKTFDYYG